MPALFRGVRARRHGDQGGQTLVLVSLWLTVLLGFAAVAVDVGRFYTERRFLQNAADAAALAAARALTDGKTAAEAEAAARSSLTQNFSSDPTGSPPLQPSLVPIYADGHAGEGAYLRDGILIGSSEVRVALRNPVEYTFGRVLNLATQDVGAQARAWWLGGMLPIAVRQFVNAPGPNTSPPSPCTDNPNLFRDFFATANTSCLGSETDSSPRSQPNAGGAFNASDPGSDPSNHGPVVAILGQGSQPSGTADFRGFIALDIRNFQANNSQLYYNGITSSTNRNTLKEFEAAWIDKGGYPGPDLPPITSPPDPNDQVGIISGNSTGAAIDAMLRRNVPGDEILVCIYPGYVMAIPDFTVAPPNLIALPNTGTTAVAGSFKVTRNQAFSGTVTLSTLADTNDPTNPMVVSPPTLVGADPITYTPNPVTPSLGQGQTVQMTNITTNGAANGIYALWIQGQAGSPYLTTKYEPFAVRIGTVTRSFVITADSTSKDAGSGANVSFNLTLQNSPDKNTNFGAPVSLSVDSPYPAGTGSVSFSSSSVTPSRNGTSTTLTINTGTLSTGSHRFIVRATGMNGDTPTVPVTKLLPLYVNVNPSDNSGSDIYVDITGFAVMRIASMDSNTITAYAITPLVTNLNDPLLKRGRTARLVPWT